MKYVPWNSYIYCYLEKNIRLFTLLSYQRKASDYKQSYGPVNIDTYQAHRLYK